MFFRLKAIFILNVLLFLSVSFGNQTDWPHWLDTNSIVTLSLDFEQPEFGKDKINAIQIEPVTQWAKSGPATLGFIDNDGLFKPKFNVEYSEWGSSAILVDDSFVIEKNLQIKDKLNSKMIGSAQVLELVSEIILKKSNRIPKFDVVRQQFNMSNQYIHLAEPILIHGVKFTALYFEPYYSTYPGSEVVFGNLDSKGEFIAAPLSARATWDYRSGWIAGGRILIHLRAEKSISFYVYRGEGGKGAFITGDGIGSIRVASLTVVSDKEYFFKESKLRTKILCQKILNQLNGKN